MRASAAAPCVFVLFLALVTCRADVSAVIRPVPDGCSTSGSAGDGTLHLKSCQFHRQADDPHTMDLKSTGLASISPTAFDGLLLVSLDLSFNYLDETSITPALLDDQVLLERVRLDNNNIASIDEQRETAIAAPVEAYRPDSVACVHVCAYLCAARRCPQSSSRSTDLVNSTSATIRSHPSRPGRSGTTGSRGWTYQTVN